MADGLSELIKRKSLQIFIIVFVCIAVYLPTVSHEFIGDDQAFFVTWQTPKSFANLPAFFQGAVPTGQQGVYRPLRTMLYAIDNVLWGDASWGYHLQALLMNAGIALLVYGITLELTESELTAFVTSLLFGLHPAHTEAITWAVASMDTFGLLLAFGSFYLYLTVKDRKKTWRYRVSVLLAFSAFLSYEVTLILPVLYVLYDFCLGHSLKKSIRQKYPYFIAAALYLFMRVLFFQVGGRGEIQTMQSYFYMLVTTSKAFYQYLTILLFPVNLSLDHVVNGIDALDKLFNTPQFLTQPIVDIQNIISLLVVGILIVAFFALLRKQPIISFCIGWLLLALLPVSNVFPTETFFFERWVFFASFGFCLLLGFLLTEPFSIEKKVYRNLLGLRLYVFVLLAICYVVLTYSRNQDWANRLTFWGKTVQQAPHSATAWEQLGLVQDDMNNKDLAISSYQKAIVYNPNNFASYNNIGVIYYQSGQFQKAIPEFEAAYAINPTDLDYKNNLLLAQEKLGEEKQSMKSVHQSVKGKSNKSADEYQIELTSLMKKKNISGLMSLLNQAVIDYPKNTTFLQDYAVAYDFNGNYNESIIYFKKAIAIKPSASLYDNLAATLEAKGQYEDAKKAYKSTLLLDPKDKVAQSELKNLASKGF